MARKTPSLTPPSQQSIQLVLATATNAPLQNLQHAAAVQNAINEVASFFQQLMAPKPERPHDAASA